MFFRLSTFLLFPFSYVLALKIYVVAGCSHSPYCICSQLLVVFTCPHIFFCSTVFFCSVYTFSCLQWDRGSVLHVIIDGR